MWQPINATPVFPFSWGELLDERLDEILATADELGISGFYKGLRSPLRIKTRKGNTIYFKGIGGADYSRSILHGSIIYESFVKHPCIF